MYNTVSKWQSLIVCPRHLETKVTCSDLDSFLLTRDTGAIPATTKRKSNIHRVTNKQVGMGGGCIRELLTTLGGGEGRGSQ